jgi:hypothetical protein
MGKKPENYQMDSAGMVAALAPTTAENYLGDPKVVDRLLRDYANSCIQRWLAMEDRNESARLDVEDAAGLVAIFLGNNPQFPPIANWNKAGVIDRWLVDEFHIGGATANERVQWTIVTFLMRMRKQLVDNEDQPDNVNQMLTDGLVQEFTALLLGFPDWAGNEE